MPRPERAPAYEVVWRVFRPIVIFLTSCLLVVGVLLTAGKVVYENYLMPVDPADSARMPVVIERGSSISSIARQLKEADLVRNKGVFQYLTELLGKGHQLKAGSYELSKDMTMTEIIDVLVAGDGGSDVMRFKIIEGLTVEGIAQSLVSQGVFDNADRFLELCRDGSAFASRYPFVKQVTDKQEEGRLYTLEGYLFPDTYEIYVDASEETVIQKMLDRTKEIFGAQYYDRADELNMSMDEVMTLASLIEKEGKTGSFAKVSAVFHNRLKEDMTLGSDVTVQYALGIRNLVLTQDQLDTQSPYNTYVHKGLPIGPVCNPGVNAIEAALYPDEDYVEEEYLYFTLTDPETGELAFSKTLKEHDEIAAQWRPVWEAYDQKQREKAAASPTPSPTASPSPTVTPAAS